MNTWEVRYKLEKSGKYFFRRIKAVYQHEANAIFDADMPNAIRIGSAKKVLKLEHVLYPVCLKLFSDNLIEIDGEEIIYSEEAENLLHKINAIIPE